MKYKLIYQNRELEVPRYDINELLKGYNPNDEPDLWECIEDDP